MSRLNRSYISSGHSIVSVKEIDKQHYELERIIESLEIEKRECSLLDQEIEFLEKERFEMKSSTRTNLPPLQSESYLKHKILILEKKLELEQTQLSETHSQNKLKRIEVNNMRKDNHHYKRSIQNLSKNIVEYDSLTNLKQREYSERAEKGDKFKKEIDKIRSRSVNSNQSFSQRLTELNSVVLNDLKKKIDMKKTIDEGILARISLKPLEDLDISRILRIFLKSLKAKLRESKRLMDYHIKRLSKLEFVMDKIIDDTGLVSPEEIVTAFIKSEEQQYQVHAYINEMNAEIDVLEENVKRINETIHKFESSNELKSTKLKEYFECLIKKQETFTAKKDSKLLELNSFKEALQSLMPYVKVISN